MSAVRRLRGAGIAFAITSGRPPRGLSTLLGPLELTTPIAAFNGGMLVSPDWSPIEEQRNDRSGVVDGLIQERLRQGEAQ